MPDDSNGVHSLPPGTIVSAGDTVLPSQHNPMAQDLSKGLTDRYSKDGRAPLTGNMNVNGFLLRNLGTPTANADAATKQYVDTLRTDLTSSISNSTRGYLFGLTLSNSSGDAVNDIDISAGSAASDEISPHTMDLSSALTKRLDAAWAVGTGNGGWLGGASMPNGTGHAFLIQRSDTGVVDVAFSSSLSPTLPTNYDRKRRIGSILRESGSIVAFKQNGDDFTRAQKLEVSSTAPAANALTSISVPVGVIVQPKFNVRLFVNQSTNARTFLGGSETDSLSVVQDVRTVAGQLASDNTQINSGFFTNTSAQVLFGKEVTAGSIAAFSLITCGWIDTRGRL